jgi:hypothetical protein
MVLDMNRESLVVRVVGRPLRDGPRREHAIHFKAQVEMKIPRGVLVDDERTPGHGRDGADGFG